MVLLRRMLGDVLRRHRVRQSRTLRDVSVAAGVSLGYLSEVERGRKEASSELLAAICGALDVSLAEVLREVSDDLAREERRLRVAPVGFSSGPRTLPTLAGSRPVAGIAPLVPSRTERPTSRPAGRPATPVGPVALLMTRSSTPFVAA
ncbi:MAG: helix-turn-helix transcriptional regulator [Frankiaceae bacterium]|nr:helix-turn-helix transcriptional regulator [Frankiaceae bacterium]